MGKEDKKARKSYLRQGTIILIIGLFITAGGVVSLEEVIGIFLILTGLLLLALSGLLFYLAKKS